jgi:streptogramin lyase/two-component sensor histidine kinase
MLPTTPRIIWLLAVLWCAVGSTAWSQHVITNYRHYRMSDGLPSERVSCLYEASDGQLWVGTNGGLCRFDGSTFTTLPVAAHALPVGVITALHSPDDTLLFIGTLRGLAVYNLHTGLFENHRLNDIHLRPGSGHEVFSLSALPGQDILVNIGEYLAVIGKKGNTLRISQVTDDMNSSVNVFNPPFFVDEDSTIMLVHQHNSGAQLLDLATLQMSLSDGRYGEGERPNGHGDPFVLLNRLPGGAHYLLASYWGHYLYHAPSTNVRRDFGIPPGQPGGVAAHPSRIVQDPMDPDIIWVASRFGLRRFSSREITFTSYVVSGTNADFTATNIFTDLVIDRHGQKWLASNTGLIKISKLTWLFQDLGFEQVAALRDVSFHTVIADPQGRPWVASAYSGIFRADPPGDPMPLTRWHSKLASGSNITFDLRRIDGHYYAATDRGILKFNEATERFEDTGLIPERLLANEASAVCIHKDIRGEWWFGVGRGVGLVRIDTAGNTRVYDHYLAAPGTALHLPIRYPSVIAEDAQGDLWMGLARVEGMLIRWDRKADRFDTVHVAVEGLPVQRIPVTDLHFDREDNLWVTTYSYGVLRRDMRTGTWTRHDVRDGLRSNDVTSAAFDGDGNLWVGTFNGIAVLQRGTNRFRAFSMEDGMPHANVSWIGFPYPDDPNRLVVTGVGYARSADIRHLLEPMRPLRPVIHGIHVESEPYTPVPENRFSYDRSHFQFFFTAVNLVNGTDNRYMYKLEGLDARWVDAGGRRFANYANVPPGEYVFHVKVGNANNGWSEPVSFGFRVDPPFWQRWWFVLLVTVVVAAMIYAAYRVRVDRLLEMERVRSHISRDLHDDIGSTLSSINILAHATRSRMNERDQGRVEESLVKIGERTQRMLDNMTDIIWSIKPENDSLPNVLARMRDYASGMLEAREIDHTIIFPDQFTNLQLPLELKNNLYLVFKEAVNNLVKYSGASKALIQITIRNRTLHLLVQDNGRGFDTTARRRGNGLSNMQRRAEESTAELKVESSPGKGTTIEFIISRIP